MTDPSDLLPDEDQLAFPKAWTRYVRPFRGRTAPVKNLHGELEPEKGREYLLKYEQEIRRELAHEANRAGSEAGRAFLDGRADVRGAAAVATLAVEQHRDGRYIRLRPWFDHLVAEHGLPFAVAAVTEFLTLGTDTISGPVSVHKLVRVSLTSTFMPGRVTRNDEIAFIRNMIVATDDEEYGEIIAALSSLRQSPIHRVVVCALVPNETDWVDEACREQRSHAPSAETKRLILESVTTAEQLADVDELEFGTWFDAEIVADFVHRLGSAALPALVHCIGSVWDSNQRKLLWRAIAMLPSDAAMNYLLENLDEPSVMSLVMEAAPRFPRRALRVIAERLPEAYPDERSRLATLLRADPVILDVALPLMDNKVQSSIAPLVGQTAKVPEGDPADLPELLVTPPWTVKRRKPKPLVIDIEPPSGTVMAWAEGEREQWADTGRQPAEYSDEQWREMLDPGSNTSKRYALEALAHAPDHIAIPFKDRWNGEMGSWPSLLNLRRALARFGAEIVDRLLPQLSLPDYAGALPPIRSAGVASIAAHSLGRKTTRVHAVAWFDRHGPEAAEYLIPDVLGADRTRRKTAEAALDYLAHRLGPEAIRAAAETFGDEAAAAIDVFLDVDPLEARGRKIPKIGTWVNPAMLPQVLMADRETALPAASLPHLVTVLALGTPLRPYPGVEVAKGALDPDSLRRFSWALFEAWLDTGAPAADGWPLTQLIHTADDETVYRLTELIRKWPGEGQHQRASTGLEVLGAIGTETALRALHRISEKVKFEGIKYDAGVQMKTIAGRLGLDTEQLADRLVPDLGLGEAVVFDYGPRQFRVTFDERLQPFVQGDDGKPRKTLPKPGAKDDPETAAAAYKRFSRLQKELRTAAVDQIARLEHAMVDGRFWTRSEFDEHLVRHALMWHLVRRLVWLAETESGPVAFRLAEDGSYADVDDNAFTIPEQTIIRLPHPILLGDAVTAWAEILSDYEIAQPFEQVLRPVRAFTEADLRTGRLTRFEGVKIPSNHLLGLKSRGWTFYYQEMRRSIRGLGRVLVRLDPGSPGGGRKWDPEQVVTQVELNRKTTTGDLPDIDPVAASEALADLARITGIA